MPRSSAEIVAYYHVLREHNRLRDVLTAEFRCRVHGCQLGVAFTTVDGPVFYVPAYKLSTVRNMNTSVKSARMKNTTDGDNHWRERGFDLAELEQFSPAAAIDVQCDHILPLPLTAAWIAAAAGSPGSPTRRMLPEG